MWYRHVYGVKHQGTPNVLRNRNFTMWTDQKMTVVYLYIYTTTDLLHVAPR